MSAPLGFITQTLWAPLSVPFSVLLYVHSFWEYGFLLQRHFDTAENQYKTAIGGAIVIAGYDDLIGFRTWSQFAYTCTLYLEIQTTICQLNQAPQEIMNYLTGRKVVDLNRNQMKAPRIMTQIFDPQDAEQLLYNGAKWIKTTKTIISITLQLFYNLFYLTSLSLSLLNSITEWNTTRNRVVAGLTVVSNTEQTLASITDNRDKLIEQIETLRETAQSYLGKEVVFGTTATVATTAIRTISAINQTESTLVSYSFDGVKIVIEGLVETALYVTNAVLCLGFGVNSVSTVTDRTPPPIPLIEPSTTFSRVEFEEFNTERNHLMERDCQSVDVYMPSPCKSSSQTRTAMAMNVEE